jgi:hypothetical protein
MAGSCIGSIWLEEKGEEIEGDGPGWPGIL